MSDRKRRIIPNGRAERAGAAMERERIMRIVRNGLCFTCKYDGARCNDGACAVLYRILGAIEPTTEGETEGETE